MNHLTTTREMTADCERLRAQQELLDAWHGPTHPTVRQRRGSLLASFLMGVAGPFILAGAIYGVALKELWIITATTVRRHALELLCVAVMLYVLWALQLVGETVLFALFSGATEILARGLRRAHLWFMCRPMTWRKLIALNERKPKKRSRLDDDRFIWGAVLATFGTLGGLVLAIGITSIGA